MFRFALFFVMLSSPVLFAQREDPYMAKYVDARKDIEERKLDAALKKLDEAIRGANAEKGYPLQNIALLHYEIGEVFLMKEDFKNAEAAYGRTLTIRMKVLGPNDVGTSNVLDRLGQVYVTYGFYAKAEPLLLQALEIRAAKLDNKHYLIGRSYDNLAELYEKNGQTAKADSFYLKSVEFHARLYGENTMPVATTLTTYARYLMEIGRYKEAEVKMNQVMQIVNAQPNRDKLALQTQHAVMGNIQRRLGRYNEAEKLLLKSVQIAERVSGRNTLDTVIALTGLADLYSDVGLFREAEPLSKRAYQIREQILGKEHSETIQSLQSLSLIHIQTNQYNQAELELLTCIKVSEARLGPNHPTVATLLNYLGSLYGNLSMTEKAEATHSRAVAIREKTLGIKHYDTAQSYTNLGVVCFSKGDYPKSKSCFERALAILQSGSGGESTLMANALVGLYRLKITVEDKTDLALIKRAIVIYVKEYGPNHPRTAILQDQLGYGYYQSRDFANAEPVLRHCLKVFQATLGDNSPQIFDTASTLAVTQYVLDDRETALSTMDKLRRQLRSHTTSVLPGLSQKDQQMFISGTDGFPLWRGLTMGLENSDKPNFTETTATWLVNSKGSLHETQAAAAQLTVAGNSQQIQKLRDVRQQIASLTLSGNGSEDGQTAKRRENLLAQEKELFAAVRDTGDRLDKPLPWIESKDIRSQLSTNSVLIDIMKFRVARLKPEGKTNQSFLKEAHYAAWITPKFGPVRIVDLGPADEIDKGVLAVRQELETAFATVKKLGEPAAEKQLNAVMTTVAAKVLHPLLKEIGNADNLVISPDGALWLLPWAALPMPNGKYLVEKFTINHVVSGRDLLKSPDAAANAKRVTAPLIIAAPDFNMTPEDALQEAKKLIAGILPKGIDTRKLAKSLGLGNVKSLEGTATEAEAVTPLLEKLYGKPRVHTDREALKSLVTTAKSPEALILSTHGFFKEDQKVELSETAGTLGQSRSLWTTNAENFEDPLLRCGLLFAGCNKANTATGAVVENGILTGSEVVSTDLRGTKLVVLSACETGLGKVNNGEGVAGLRHAFQLAGAECVVATLWQVPDIESAQLMKAFFSELVDKKNRDQALTDAQRTMIQQRRDRFGAAHPYFWAAYTVTGRVK